MIKVLLLVMLCLSRSRRAVSAFCRPGQPGRGSRISRTALAATADPPLPNFCSDCGEAAMELHIPAGDERLRAVCGACGVVTYSNPKVVVACVVRTDDHVLLAKRAIAPRLGYWGIPQGFMEHGETSREAAVREVREETGAVVSASDLTLQAVYQVPGSVQLVYQAKVAAATLYGQIATSTQESSAIQLFSLEEIPHEELCFPTVQWALEHCIASGQPGAGGPRVQQRTKFYDAALDQWSEFEDESPTL